MNIGMKLWHSTTQSLAGLKYALKNEFSFQIEIILTVILTPAAFILAIDITQLLLLLITLYMVLVIELINTAIETIVNRIGTEHNELSKIAKDVSSAAVFMGLLLVSLVWGSILFHNFYMYS